jgi:hypothetical protein
MLISAKHNSVAAGFSEVRSSLSHNLRDINYAVIFLLSEPLDKRIKADELLA